MKSLKHKKNLLIGAAFLAVLIVLAMGQSMLETTASASVADGEAPMFEVDPMWSKPLPTIGSWARPLVSTVCDRPNDRVQVFRLDGTFVKEKRIAKETLGDGAVGHCVLERRRPRNTI